MSYGAVVYTEVPKTFKAWLNQRIRWNLGGLQTLWKYRSDFLRGKNIFGYFIISYVGLSFFLGLVGFGLFARFIWLKSSLWILSFPFFLQGYNPLKLIELSIPLTILLFIGGIFLILAVEYYRLSTQNNELEKRGLITILNYSFIYRALYTIPLLISIYKLIRRDIRWYK